MTQKAVEFSCEALKSCEDQLNKMDSGAGDGDCGTTLKRGATALQNKIKSNPISSLGQLFHMISKIAEEDMGGSAGAMYSILFTTASAKLSEKSGQVKDIMKAIEEGKIYFS